MVSGGQHRCRAAGIVIHVSYFSFFYLGRSSLKSAFPIWGDEICIKSILTPSSSSSSSSFFHCPSRIHIKHVWSTFLIYHLLIPPPPTIPSHTLTMQACTHTYTETNTLTTTHTHKRMHTKARMQAHTHVHTKHTHAQAHTHTQK